MTINGSTELVFNFKNDVLDMQVGVVLLWATKRGKREGL